MGSHGGMTGCAKGGEQGKLALSDVDDIIGVFLPFDLVFRFFFSLLSCFWSCWMRDADDTHLWHGVA